MFLHSSGSNLSQASEKSIECTSCWSRETSASRQAKPRHSFPHGPCCQQDLRLERTRYNCCKNRRRSDQTEYLDPLTSCSCHKTYYHYTITGNYYTATPRKKLPLNKNISLDETPLSRSYYDTRHKPSLPNRDRKNDIKNRNDMYGNFKNNSELILTDDFDRLDINRNSIKPCPSVLDATTPTSTNWQKSRSVPPTPGPRGSLSVLLNRKNGAQLGLGIAGGADRAVPPTISFLRPGFIAHRCDQLQVGERLVAVNGILLKSLTHEQILTVLRSAGDTVKLDIEYDLNDPVFLRPTSTMNKCTEIVLEKESGSFGITLRGGAYGPDHSKSRPITVTGIRPGGPAHREGRLRVGDRIISINGIDVYSATLSVAQKILQDCTTHATVTVEYDVSILETVRKATGPLLLEIDKNPGVDLGAILTICEREPSAAAVAGGRRRAILVEDVVPASVADRCGAVHAGDELLAIDGIGLEYTTLAEARQLLRGQSSTVRLELIPFSQMCGLDHGKKSKSKKDRQKGSSPKYGSKHESMSPERQVFERSNGYRGSQVRAKSYDRTYLNEQSKDHSSSKVLRSDFTSPTRRAHTSALSGSVPNVHNVNVMNHVSNMTRSYHQSRASTSQFSGSITGSLTTSIPCGQVCHTETMDVVLHSYTKGNFGFVLHRHDVRGSNTDSTNQSPLFISYIEKGSPADKCGVLQVGDRVISINDWYTASGTVEEAMHIIRHSSSPLNLTVEFDVIESVLPSSGLFTVKLAKRGNNLGIICRSETDGEKGEPVIISDIRTGSVAHRCGSIQPADRIIAIDNIPLDSCTVEEAMRLLQRSSEIVKLCIKKGNSEFQDIEPPQTITYSLELSRKGQPLGITIASTGERGDPVIISQLASGGLAERTGALHVGDHILAINGESIEGKTVAEAMRILQQSPDLVALKVSRIIDPIHSSYIPSIAQYSPISTTVIRRPPVSHGVNQTLSTIHSDSVSESSDKMGTPIQSIDSAVESLEDSPDGGFKHGTTKNSQPSTSTNFKPPDEFNSRLHQSIHEWRTNNDKLNQLDKNANPINFRGSLKRNKVEHKTNVNVTLPLEAISAVGSSDQTGWDSGLSSTTDTNVTNECCACASQKSGADNEDWMRILEALETVGEAEMLKKLEDSIMSGNVPNCKHTCQNPSPSTSTSWNLSPQSVDHKSSSLLNRPIPPPANLSGAPALINLNTTSSILKHPPLATSSTIHMQVPPAYHKSQRSNSSEHTDSVSVNSIIDGTLELPPAMPPPKPPRFDDHPTSPIPQRLSSILRQLSGNDPSIPFITSPPLTSNYYEVPKPNLVDSNRQQHPSTFRISLKKDPVIKSFGFSVSDGVGENPGVFINAILPGGPADRCGMVKPLDKILQINDTNIQYLDCDLAVPLLATDQVDLVLYRDPTLKFDQQESNQKSRVSTSNV